MDGLRAESSALETCECDDFVCRKSGPSNLNANKQSPKTEKPLGVKSCGCESAIRVPNGFLSVKIVNLLSNSQLQYCRLK